jgi:hypothetical protein
MYGMKDNEGRRFFGVGWNKKLASQNLGGQFVFNKK